jgi:hypothetical protein
MAERKYTTFKSSVTDFTAIKKRMEELGIFREQPGAKNGVDVVPTEPGSKPEPGKYYQY